MTSRLDGSQKRGGLDGTVREALPNALFAIELDNGSRVLGHLPADIRTRAIRVVPGDRVRVELSTNDHTRCRITYRYR